MKKSDLYAVIMAGGSGTRFWPLSRRRRPKQFLPIATERTMIEETFCRISHQIPLRRIFTIANASQSKMIRRLLPQLPKANAIVEPCARDTTPSLILATAHVYLKDPEAVVGVFASDHLIVNVPIFLKKLQAAAEAARRTESLVTFGVRPTFPSTGYGYIHYSRDGILKFAGEKFFPVESFREKPSLTTAKEFVKAGDFVWNSGMFLWRASVFARAIERFAPDYHPYWERMLKALKKKDRTMLSKIFEDIPALSIDYALMEKAEHTLVCAGDFGWSDVGSWSAVGDFWPRDENGNARRGMVISIDGRENIVYNPGKTTALLGVEGLIIVQTKDVLLVGRRDRDQEVKKILEMLAKTGKTELI